MSDDIPDVPVERARKSMFDVASLVWLVPVGALIIAIYVAWNNYSDRGPLIEITFDSARGIIAEETQLKYRDVTVGMVEDIGFSDALAQVRIEVRLDKDVAPFVDESAEFWVVSPEVTTSGVTGLDTVLSGVYIQGSWDAEPGGLVRSFVGRADAPLLTGDRNGARFELRTSGKGGLTENTPIVFKGIEVGRIGSANISRDGRWVFADAVIYAPHDRLVTTETRFWDASGFSFNVGPSGAQLDFSSLASLISGGVTFETLVSGGQEVGNGAVFEVYPNEATARRSVFEDTDGQTTRVQALFAENVSGLTSGAAVEWRGLKVGEVANVTGLVDADRFGDRRARLIATLDLNMTRFGLPDEATEEAALEFLAGQIDEGMRARLASASLLTGGLKVELAMLDEAEPAALTLEDVALPTLPVTDSEISDMRASATGVLERVNALPFEELLDNAIAFLDNAAALVSSEEIRQTPVELRRLLADARGVIGSEAIQALPSEITAVLTDLQAVVGDLRSVLQSVDAENVVERLLAAVDGAANAANSVGRAAETLPDLIDRIEAVAAKAAALPLEQTLSDANGLIASVRDILEQSDTQALPARLGEALAGLTVILDDLEREGAAASLTSALASAEEAARAVQSSTSGIPELIQQLQGVAARVEELPLEDVARELSEVLDTADTLFADVSESELPAALSGALRELDASLAEIREGGLIASANQTLDATGRAADSVARAADELPAIVERLERLLASASTTLAAYSDNSDFNRTTLSALRDVQRAADAVASLARALERRPNSLILGR